ncbi:hypothetical protein CANINC_000262 [Pichia inconspicua]|uniref:GLC7-interacting protein 3 n=1 Tax=Pichia inconspicua TaxID=52247 RepID=A0A4T0X8T5_9ASCO|nr:hypothetical protein CANINC_000262 [[Candida] inconspicua]
MDNSTEDEFLSNFLDPGVSNGDVDWLFRGREIKKLTKKTNTINTEVQSQLLQAQQKALLHAKGTLPSPSDLTDPISPSIQSPSISFLNINGSVNKSGIPKSADISRLSSPVSIPSTGTHTTPLKSSLKPSSVSSNNAGLKVNTTMISTSPFSPNSPNNSLNRSLEIHKLQQQQQQQSNDTTIHTSTEVENNVASPTTRSRSSSLFGRPKSSTPTDPKPKKSLFSALSSKLKSSSTPITTATTTQQNSKLASSSTHSSQCAPTPQSESSTHKVSTKPVILSQPDKVHSNIEKLNKVSFNRVHFALDSLPEDPQQQIPSRRPKRGNVLIPEDMLAPPPKLSIGITNSFNEQTKDQKPTVDPELYKEALSRHSYFIAESKKHLEEAHLAALRMAKEVSNFKKRRSSFLRSTDDDDDDEEENITDSRFLNSTDDIDTPLHEHVNYFGSNESENDADPNENDSQNNQSKDISLETLYTRCCHLREILPIPATLKQLKDKSKPLPILKMLNPKPTLIDILSFSDFLAIAPIITVVFDNVTIDTEMLKIILISLTSSTMLDKLSMRNVPIDNNGWLLLSKFLKINQSLQKLDISQQRIRKSSDNSKYVVRSELDWDLFTEALYERGGIEELVIHGCILTDSQFDNLVNRALSLKTKRLGLASTQLNVHKMETLSKWISKSNSFCEGIDFAFNDLSGGHLKKFNKVLAKLGSKINLHFFSLNSTNVSFEECSQLIQNLSNLESLRFLDLSNNPHLFPDIIPVLRDYLPKFPDLRRIHFDFDNLTEFTIVQLCLIFQNCKRLVHVSILGNNALGSKSIASLYSAVKNSHLYNIDMDYDGLDEEFLSRISFYLMRNMQHFLNNDVPLKKFKTKEEDLIFDGSLLTKAAEQLLEKGPSIEESERIIIYHSLVDKTRTLRTEVLEVISKLFKDREDGNLSTEGKEKLLRLCLLDDSLDNIIDIFNEEVDERKSSNKPNLIRQLSSQLSRHHSSEIIDTVPAINIDDEGQNPPTEDPHIVVTDADSLPVDSLTGQRVLIRNYSQTNVHSKKLEEEEGELHRWGFFVQQQKDILPDDEHNNIELREKERLRAEAEAAEAEKQRIETEKKRLKINTIPSGSELRETIMKVKGIQSISDLIKKVNKDYSTVENIYKHADTHKISKIEEEGELGVSNLSLMDKSPVSKTTDNRAESLEPTTYPLSPTVSINSMGEDPDEVYERILNDVIRVRSNK